MKQELTEIIKQLSDLRCEALSIVQKIYAHNKTLVEENKELRKTIKNLQKKL